MFDLKAYSEKVRRIVEDAMDARLRAADGGAPRLIEAMRYCFFSGGKRVRPLLVFAAAETVRGSRGEESQTDVGSPEFSVAVAVEAIHTYSLIHDDLPAMDDDDLRRGKPTCHKAFDEATAILAGDALLNSGFQILIEGIEEYGTPLVRAARVIGNATGIGGMVTGQVLDLESVNRQVTPEMVKRIHENKTGALLHACVVAGGHVAEADESQIEALSSFGRSVGLAFQIVDDLLDLEQTTERIGKRAGKDEEQNKATYPAAFGIEESHRLAAELTRTADESLAMFGQAAAPLHALANLILRRDH